MSWQQNEKYVNEKLVELSQDLKDIKKSLVNINIEIARLQTKAATYGGIAGAIPAIIVLIIEAWSKMQ